MVGMLQTGTRAECRAIMREYKTIRWQLTCSEALVAWLNGGQHVTKATGNSCNCTALKGGRTQSGVGYG